MLRTLISILSLATAMAVQAADPPIRLRGTIEKVDPKTLVVKGQGGKIVPLALGDGVRVDEVLPIDPNALQEGTFVGTTAVPRPDGSLSAVEVHVFPEAARGTGEGHRPSDLQPGSTMTNATVSKITSGNNDRTMTLRSCTARAPLPIAGGCSGAML